MSKIDAGAMSAGDSAHLLALLSDGGMTVDEAKDGISQAVDRIHAATVSPSEFYDAIRRIPPLSEEEEHLIAIRLNRSRINGHL